MAQQPLSPTAQGFDTLDLFSLARVTTKTFERLAPFSLLRDPSSHDAHPTVAKIVDKIKTYLQAIDTSMQVVHSAYQMSKLASQLWNPVPVPAPSPAPAAAAAGTNEKKEQSRELAADAERQQRLEDLVMLADAASDKAQKINVVFREVQQDFYRIAALTKDMDSTVHIPVDPSLPKTIKKPLKDIGSDLVANLSLLGDFSRHTSDLASWCAWIKAGIIRIDGTVVPPQENDDDDDDDDTPPVDANAAAAVRAKWDRVRADCLVYHSLISDIQTRYASMLPLSSELWQVALLREADSTKDKNEGAANSNPKARGRAGARARAGHVRRRMSSLFRDAVRHLGCHACMV